MGEEGEKSIQKEEEGQRAPRLFDKTSRNHYFTFPENLYTIHLLLLLIIVIITGNYATWTDDVPHKNHRQTKNSSTSHEI